LLERVESLAEHKNLAGVDRVDQTLKGPDVELCVSVTSEAVFAISNGMALCMIADVVIVLLEESLATAIC
jgi:hypothetical protein